jgi:hypothetical protein
MYLPSSKGIITIIFELDKAMISNHFGKKPVKGGKPPSDRRSKIKVPEIPIDMEVILISWVDVLVVRELNKINIGETIKV